MVMGVRQLSDATIQRLLDDPPLVWLVLAPDDPEMYRRVREEVDGPKKPGLVARLFGRGPEPPPPPKVIEPLTLGEGEGKDTYLDKAWHGIHFLLTGSADGGNAPLDFLVDGGEPVGDIETGLGPSRVFTARETREIAAALAAISDDDLRKRFKPDAMDAADIYPNLVWVRDGDNALEYVMEYFEALRAAVVEAAGAHRGLMVTLS
jgi:hypothetical protein